MGNGRHSSFVGGVKYAAQVSTSFSQHKSASRNLEEREREKQRERERDAAALIALSDDDGFGLSATDTETAAAASTRQRRVERTGSFPIYISLVRYFLVAAHFPRWQ